jgi:hypothetical protein
MLKTLFCIDFNAGGHALLGNIFQVASGWNAAFVISRFHEPHSFSNGWTHFAEFGSELLDLLTRFREGAGAIDCLGRMI